LFRWHDTCEVFVAVISTWLIGWCIGVIVNFSMSVEQSCGAPAAEPLGFGGREDDGVDADPSAAGVLAPPAAAEAVLEAVVEAAADVPEAAFGVPEAFEPPHPAANSTASVAATAAPNRVPTGRLMSEVFIFRSMPRPAEHPVANSTTFPRDLVPAADDPTRAVPATMRGMTQASANPPGRPARRPGRVCLVAAGRGPSDRDVERVAETVAAIKDGIPDVELCVCLGLLKDGQGRRLQPQPQHR
jgi:hypothetical protein